MPRLNIRTGNQGTIEHVEFSDPAFADVEVASEGPSLMAPRPNTLNRNAAGREAAAPNPTNPVALFTVPPSLIVSVPFPL